MNIKKRIFEKKEKLKALEAELLECRQFWALNEESPISSFCDKSEYLLELEVGRIEEELYDLNDKLFDLTKKAV